MGVNGVPVAPHGLILGENEATPSRKLFKHLPDLKTAINIKKEEKNTKKGSAAWAKPLNKIYVHCNEIYAQNSNTNT